MPVHVVKTIHRTRSRVRKNGEMEYSAICNRPRDFATILAAFFSEDNSEVAVVWSADTGPMPPSSD